MTAAGIQTKFLLTEGKDDACAVAGLMGNHVQWGDQEADWPVKIEWAGSIAELLKPVYLSAWFKRSGLEAIGIMFDANESFAGRRAGVRAACSNAFSKMPENLPADGLVIEGENGVRLGVWIMPDNQSRGMLETFLRYLVPSDAQPLWDYARSAADEARKLGAPYKQPTHRDKADIHTWLAWQDPPGRPFGEALKSKCLDPRSPAAQKFAQWFIRLYQLEGIQLG